MMRQIFPLVATCVAIFSSFSALAQDYEFQEVKRFSMRNSGVIRVNNQVKGYFVFYESEKVDNKNRAFDIVVLDENLNEVVKERVVEPKRTVMLEAAYNGTNLLFKFFDTKNDIVSYRIVDSKGTLGPKVEREANKEEARLYGLVVASEENTMTLNPFGNGFVDIFAFKDKKGYSYSVNSIDADGNLGWTYSPDHVKGVDAAEFLTAGKDQMALLTVSKKSVMAGEENFGLLVLDNKGNVAYETDLENKKYNLMAHNAYFDETKNSLVIMGEYYDLGDKRMKSESKGVFVKTYSKSGDPLEERLLSWDKDILNKVAAEYKKQIKSMSICFHNIIRTSSGKVLAVGELYKKQISASGMGMKVAAAALGGSTNASALEIKIGNMVIIELNADYSLAAVHVLEKQPTHFVLAQGYQYANQHRMARMLKEDGYFDYAFSQGNEDNSEISIGYTDMERQEGKVMRQLVYNSVNYSDEGGLGKKPGKMKMQSDAYAMLVAPGKSGYVMVMEYFRKKKIMKMHLEPVGS